MEQGSDRMDDLRSMKRFTTCCWLVDCYRHHNQHHNLLQLRHRQRRRLGCRLLQRCGSTLNQFCFVIVVVVAILSNSSMHNGIKHHSVLIHYDYRLIRVNLNGGGKKRRKLPMFTIQLEAISVRWFGRGRHHRLRKNDRKRARVCVCVCVCRFWRWGQGWRHDTVTMLETLGDMTYVIVVWRNHRTT